MNSGGNAFARLVRERGVAFVWELAAAAAIAPYVIGPAFNAWRHPSAMAQPAAAASLAATLILLAMLRAALETFSVSLDPGSVLGRSRRDSAAQPAESQAPERSSLEVAIEGHQPGKVPACLGVLRFANYDAMAAFDPAAASRVIQLFRTRFEEAVSARRIPTQVDDDCFAVWFANDAEAERIADELKAVGYVLTQEVADEDLTVAPDVHVAVSIYRAGDTLAGLLARAQAALVPLKRFAAPMTGDRVRVAGNDLADRFALEQALRRAVREGQLSLRYQPFVDAASGTVAGAEVLLRWTHPDLGDISPTRFVPILETTGLIHEIGLWTINSGCRQLRDWRAAGKGDLRLAINLSAIQLQNRSLGQVIERTVASHGLAPADIELELTETAAMEDQVRTLEVLQDLRRIGFGIAIDDFGCGHSNLSYLKNLPFTKLKIDREFVTDVDTRPGSRAICKAMIELSAGLDIQVLAEGVERYEEISTLRRLGCHVFQGFYFSRPLTADELTTKMDDRDWMALIASDVHRGRAELQKRLVS